MYHAVEVESHKDLGCLGVAISLFWYVAGSERKFVGIKEKYIGDSITGNSKNRTFLFSGFQLVVIFENPDICE